MTSDTLTLKIPQNISARKAEVIVLFLEDQIEHKRQADPWEATNFEKSENKVGVYLLCGIN